MGREDTEFCGNCHAYFRDGDKFCPYCGTRRGEGAFEPVDNRALCVYGPPITASYRCDGCGYEWTVRRLGTDNSKFCPKCGHTPISKTGSGFDFPERRKYEP